MAVNQASPNASLSAAAADVHNKVAVAILQTSAANAKQVGKTSLTIIEQGIGSTAAIPCNMADKVNTMDAVMDFGTYGDGRHASSFHYYRFHRYEMNQPRAENLNNKEKKIAFI